MIDVRRGRDRAPSDLFRTRVVRRQRPPSSLPAGWAIAAEQLRDAEIKQLGNARRRHENICRLQIAMDDQVAMRVGHRIAHVAHERATRLGVELLAVAVFRDRNAFDVIHRKIRQAVGCRAAIEKANDVGMIETRENLALLPEPFQHFAEGQAGAQDLERDEMIEFGIGAAREVDLTHAAHANDAFDCVGPKLLPYTVWRLARCAGAGFDKLLEERGRIRFRFFKKSCDGGAEPGIGRALTSEEGVRFRLGKRRCGVEKLLNAVPVHTSLKNSKRKTAGNFSRFAANFARKPCFGDTQLTADGRGGAIQRFGNLHHAESTKVSQLQHLGAARVFGREFV